MAFQGRLISVEVWEGRYREIVRHPGAAAMVPWDGDDVVLVRQVREAIRSETLEIPAGILDKEGEAPKQCAVRELREEAGYVAFDVEPLGSVHTSPGFTDERIWLFQCRAERTGQPEEDGIEVVVMPFADALHGIRDGRITDAKTVAALLLARMQRD